MICLVAGALAPIDVGGVLAQTGSFIAPPRTIADITAILDQEKPDHARIAQMQTDADAELSADADAGMAVDFYYRRARARSDLGRFRDAITDLKSGIAVGRREYVDVERLQQLLGYLYNWSGDNRLALEVFLALAAESNQNAKRGYLFSAYRWISFLLIGLGDLDQAQAYLEKNEALFKEAQFWPHYAQRGSLYLAHIEYSRGRLFEARGKLREAEAAYRRAEVLFTEVLSQFARESPERWSLAIVRDNMIVSQGNVKARQGRFAEGEADARRALLSRLASAGKYNLTTATIVISRFAAILLDQGRYVEAEKLTRMQIEIYQALGVTQDSQHFAAALNKLASLLALQARWPEAAQTYAALDKLIKTWEPARKAQLTDNADRIFTLYNTDQIAEGILRAEQLVARNESRFGDRHVNTAFARGALAIGLYRAGRNREAMDEFNRAIRVIMSAARTAEGDSDETIATSGAHEQRTRALIESYISLLGHLPDKRAAAIEGFRLADAIRGRSVQNALTQSSARAVTGHSRLAELARHEQDLAKQIAARLGLLNNLLATPSERRSAEAVHDLGTQLDKLRSEHEGVRQQLVRQFPDYVALIDPKPPTVDDIKGVLKPDEALLSFYFGSRESFVWVISKREPVVFATIGMSAEEIATKVKELRSALEPQAATVSDIPPFDVALAHGLYARLLQPIEAAWKPARSLIVVTNGALGLLPLSLLPTAPAQVQTKGPLFASYRDVRWLARTHAVTQVPSAASLLALRQLPRGSASREPFIGFGDPYFNESQAAEAAAEQADKPFVVAMADATAARGLPLARRSTPHTQEMDSAELGLLPRLPDTAAELISIARVLGLDPGKVLNLGKAANEAVVKGTDLSRYRIIDFATHGLVPGDLNGLMQPALALTAPAVAGVEGDGLLTMEEILALRLDADWVVLSACNTGSAAGAGAEAATGLGRAFFYAGTRALLVTNWSVHSASARQLVTDLFRRQVIDPKLTRGEALRQAMMALADGEGFTDDRGRTLFAYAHPLFWAPYSIIGDGGGQEGM